jgi:hypothetical protein
VAVSGRRECTGAGPFIHGRPRRAIKKRRGGGNGLEFRAGRRNFFAHHVVIPAEETRLPAACRRPGGAPAGPGAATRRRVGRWAETAAVALALAAVLAFTHWTTSLYDGFDDWGDSDYYNLLVRGWRKGQLHLDKAPRPELLALADPYDPEQNAPYRLGDASLYEGRYYLYFGPAPAFTLMLPYALLTGRELGMGGATFWFSVTAFLAASAIWLEVRRRLFPASGGGVAALGVLALGFGTHLLALVQRPMIWELPIAAGVAFTLLGGWAALRALWGRRRVAALAVAGLCLGLAVGSRPTSLFALGVLVPPVWLAWRRPGSGPGWRALALAALLPLTLCAAALMAHNAARFGNPFEWGQTYQLSGTYERQWTHFSLRFLPHNLAVYLFQRPQWTPEFPFVQAVGVPVGDLPGYFGTEEVAGLAVTFPFFWLLLALPLAWWRRAGEDRMLVTGGIAVLLAAALPVMALILGYFSTTTRYQTDFAPALALVALAGWLALERRAQAAGRGAIAAVRLAAGGAVLTALGMGVLLSFDYHGRLLEAVGPAHWRRLDRAAQDAIATVAAWSGDGGGPRVYKVRFQARPAGTVERFWESADTNLAERFQVEHLGAQLIRFGFSRGDSPVVWGPPAPVETGALPHRERAGAVVVSGVTRHALDAAAAQAGLPAPDLRDGVVQRGAGAGGCAGTAGAGSAAGRDHRGGVFRGDSRGGDAAAAPR